MVGEKCSVDGIAGLLGARLDFPLGYDEAARGYIFIDFDCIYKECIGCCDQSPGKPVTLDRNTTEGTGPTFAISLISSKAQVQKHISTIFSHILELSTMAQRVNTAPVIIKREESPTPLPLRSLPLRDDVRSASFNSLLF